MQKPNPTSEISNPTGVRRRESRQPNRRFDKINQRNKSEHLTRRQKITQSQRSKSSDTVKKNKTINTNLSPSVSVYFEDELEKNLLENPAYGEFLKKVNCPFCSKIQNNKIDFIQHLNEKCRIKEKKGKKLALFQIYSNNTIRCDICKNILSGSIRGFFLHLKSENHTLKISTTAYKMKYSTEFLYCTCCKLLIPDNYTQLQCHMEHEIHEVRRKSTIWSDYYTRRGIHCIYCYYNGNKRFKCLSCPPPDFLFHQPFEIMNHFKSSKHLRYVKKNLLNSTIYCCFCDEEVYNLDIVNHFTSDVHSENETKTTGEGHFELCFYCGFSCNTLRDLSVHMRSECQEITKLRRKMGCEENAGVEKKESEKTNRKKHEIKKERCIVIKDDIDLAELIITLRKFGKIKYVCPFDEENLLIEFQEEESVEFILLVRNFIRISGKKRLFLIIWVFLCFHIPPETNIPFTLPGILLHFIKFFNTGMEKL